MVRRWVFWRDIEVRRADLFAPLQLADHDRAFFGRLIQNLTMQAVDTLVGIDLACRVNGLNGAFICTGLTGIAATQRSLPHAQYYLRQRQE